MSNAGFSAPKNAWGTIAGLSPKSSEDGRTSSLAEAQNSSGDTSAHDVYGDLLAPSVTYAVVAAIAKTATLISLGEIKTWNNKKIMPTTVTITTKAGQSPTVTIAGVQVEASATTKRKYDVKIALTPRSKAQDVAEAFTPSDNFTEFTTVFSVDPHVETVGGVPVASDASHGKCEVKATMVDPAGNGSITAKTGGGFTVTLLPSENSPDVDYVTHEATATKFLAGTEVPSGS